jgi:hypothetical protein
MIITNLILLQNEQMVVVLFLVLLQRAVCLLLGQHLEEMGTIIWLIVSQRLRAIQSLARILETEQQMVPFVYTGFRPAWVMFKRTDSTASWFIADNKRDVNNVLSRYLFADLSDAENTAGDRADFLSNGFKARVSNTNQNASGGTYIYMAFAEMPFKYANAR